MKQGKKRLIMCAPTGSGKTVMFSYMIKNALQKGKRCLILTHRAELLTQAGGTLSNLGLDIEIINPKNKNPDFDKMLYVAMTKTIMARIKKGYRHFLDKFDLIVIDESHLQDFNNIFQYFDPYAYVIGATATPERKGNQTCLSEYYEAIVSEIKISELIEQGYLSKPLNYGVKIDLKGIKSKGGDYDNEQLGNEFNKIKLYEGVYENYNRLTPNKKAIIFSPNISASKKLVDELQKKGLNIKHVDGSMSEIERKSIIDWFILTPGSLLSNVGILTAGFDCPSIEVVILYRATKSLPLFMQMVGRGSRTTETKKEFTILDFGNNILRHGFWEDEKDWQLIKKVKKEGVAPVKDCKCGALVRASAKQCNYCGYIFPIPKTKDEIKKIELEELKRNDIELYNDFIKFEKLEIKETEKGYKKGWVVYQLKTKKELLNYAKFKGYKPGWAQLKIEQLKIGK